MCLAAAQTHLSEQSAIYHPSSEGILLGCLRMEALLSLEPVLELLGTLARDLQGDYLPLLPSVLTALADVVDEGGCHSQQRAGAVGKLPPFVVHCPGRPGGPGWVLVVGAAGLQDAAGAQ